jgi:hypothetical protein
MMIYAVKCPCMDEVDESSDNEGWTRLQIRKENVFAAAL